MKETEYVTISWQPVPAAAETGNLFHQMTPDAGIALLEMMAFWQRQHIKMFELRIRGGEDIDPHFFPTIENACRDVLGHAQIGAHHRSPDTLTHYKGESRIGIWNPVHRDFFIRILRGFPEFKP